MLKEIYQSKSLLIYNCSPCSKAKMHVEPYQDKIKPGQYLLDLIYSDVSGLDLQSYSRAKYYIIFLNDYDKTSKVIQFFSKNGVLAAFDLFQKRNQYGEACIQYFCINHKRKYDSHTFKNYHNKHGIRWEAIVSGNPQINRAAKRLG